MGITRLIRIATGAAGDRRKSPRNACRLNCAIWHGRKRVPARVLDVSEGGLCLLSPVALKAKQRIVIEIHVPPQGPVQVEAIAWHVRRVRSGGAGRKSWSIGMMVSKGGYGFQTLLSAVGGAARAESGAPCDETTPPPVDTDCSEPCLESVELSPEWDEWSAEWEQLFEESEKVLSAVTDAGPQHDLQMFRVRVKANDSPRTRTLTLSAASAEEAETLGRRDIGDSWKILG